MTSLLDDEELIAVQSGGEMTKQHVEQQMKEFTTFQVRFSSHGMPRMQMLSTVGLISEWAPNEEFKPKCTGGDSVPPLRLPPSVAACPEYGRVASSDPGDNTLKLREARTELEGAETDAARALDEQLRALDELLNTAPIRYSRPMLLDQLSYLFSNIARTDQLPGNQATARHEHEPAEGDRYVLAIAVSCWDERSSTGRGSLGERTLPWAAWAMSQ